MHRALIFALWLLAPSVALAQGTPKVDSVLYRGASSGTVTTQAAAAAGTWSWIWPTSAGTSGQCLISGGGLGPNTWGSCLGSSGVSGPGSSTVGHVATWANTSGTLLADTSTSALLDALGSAAQGDVLYRGASSWALLAPGTSGQFLQTQGAAANPQWATVSASPGGSSGQVQYNNAGAFGGLTNTQLTADINAFSSTLSGAAPASGGGTTNFLRADGTWAAPAGSTYSAGTGLTLTSTTFSLTNPVAVNLGGTGLASGTSGGVLAFTASGTIASSGALSASNPVIGGGAGVAPSSGSRSGNTTTFGTTTGTLTSGHCVSIDASGNLVDAGAACGSGSGTVTSVTAATPSSTLTIGGTNPVTTSGTINFDINLSHANTWAAVQSFNDGDFKLNGATSGATTVKAAATAGTTTFTLPGATSDLSATGGSSQFLKQASAGGAITSAQVATTDLSGTITDAKCVTWDSTTAVTAQTIDFPVEWTSYTITQAKAKVSGGGSFTYTIKIGGTNVTSLATVTVNSASNVNTSATGANTGSANDIVSVVIASPSGTVNQAYVCPVFTHTVN